MKEKKLLTFVLLLTAVTGAWANVEEFVVGNVSYTNTSESPQEVYVNGYSGDMPADYDLVIPSSVTNPDNNTDYAVTGINNTAFLNNTNLKSVTIPSSVTSIGDYAFADCTNLTSVTVYTPSCTLGGGAFVICNNLESIYVFSDLVDDYKAAEGWSTYENIITEMLSPNGTCGPTGHDSDVRWVLTGPENNYTLTISGTGDMMDYNGDRPWYHNKNGIIAVVIESGVTSIGEYAFASCSNLTAVTIPASLTSIGNNAFYDCANLTSITISSSVTTIDDGAFIGCTSLSSVTVDASNPKYSSDDGVLFNKAQTTLILYPAAKTATSYDIPASVESIGGGAFQNSTSLSSVTIPVSVTSIGMSAFDGCSSLVSVTIPASVTSIGMYAFANCPNLGTITMNSSPLIDGSAFNNIKSGAAVTINAPANEADSYKWATFYNKNYAFQADDDTQVFKVTLSGTKITLLEVADKIVDAGTPVVLKSSGEKPIMTWTKSSSSDEQGNDLKGTSEAITTPDNIYVLNYSTEHGVGFYKLATTGTLGVGKAYLEYDGASPSNFFGFEEGETTSIELKSSRIEELKYYDLNGRRVLNPTKGIYIVNGKKIIR